MPDSCFADSNVLLYTLSKETIKQEIAFGIWRQGVVIRPTGTVLLLRQPWRRVAAPYIPKTLAMAR
jgi:hypothetical protein